MSETNVAVDRRVGAPTPAKGLTFRKGRVEANVHEVRGGRVYYGVYRDGEDWPAGLFQCSLSHWDWLAEKAISEGATVFNFVRANSN